MGLNILVTHGGGPTAVINTSLQGLVEAARESGRIDKIYAARFGAEGILKGDLIDLTNVPVSTISMLSRTPASAIGSCRRKLTDADYSTVIETLKKFSIDCFFYNGGNDSMDTCNKVSRLARTEGLDVKVIGIPKAMDNDLEITDHCSGFGSAGRYAAEAACELALDASGLPIHVVRYDPSEVEFVQYFPEVHLLNAAAARIHGSPVQVGAQGVYRMNAAVGGNFGAFTTHRPVPAMKAMGVNAVIISHCEERDDKAGVLAEAGVTDPKSHKPYPEP